MSDDKTEEPTQKKIDQSREEGNLPDRKNIIEASVIITSFSVIYGLLSKIHEQLIVIFDKSMKIFTIDFSETTIIISELLKPIFILTIGFSLGIGLFTLFLNFFLTKFNFATKALKLKFSKLNLFANVKTLLTKKTLYQMFRMLTIFTIIIVVFYTTFVARIGDLINASHCGIPCVYEIFIGWTILIISISLGLLIFMAGVDFKFQTAFHKKQMKMSKDEVKREHKGSEGDPMIKSSRKQIAEETIFELGPADATHVVYDGRRVVALYSDNRTAPVVLWRTEGDNAAQQVNRFRKFRSKIFFDPIIMGQLYPLSTLGQPLPFETTKFIGPIIVNN